MNVSQRLAEMKDFRAELRNKRSEILRLKIAAEVAKPDDLEGEAFRQWGLLLNYLQRASTICVKLIEEIDYIIADIEEGDTNEHHR